MDKGQIGRWSKAEKELLNSTFHNNDELLYQLRDFFYQFPTKKPNLSPDVMKLLRKVFDPGLAQDVPLMDQAGLYGSLNVNDIPPEIVVLHAQAVDLVSDYIQARLSALEGKEVAVMSLEEMREPGNKSKEERFIQLKAYLTLVHAYIDSCIKVLKIGSMPEPTKEELAEMANKNSSK